MDYRDILFEKREAVAVITINRPEVYNAFDGVTVKELLDAFDRVEYDDGIRAVVLTGAGDKAFSAGGDVRYVHGLTPAQSREWLRDVTRLCMKIKGVLKPVIAAVNGWCVGGGNELNICCDLTVASAHARFGQAGLKIGSSPIQWGNQFLPVVVGDKKAKEIVFLCKSYDAHEAERLGLCNKVVPHAKLWDAVNEWCDDLVSLDREAIALSKLGLNYISDQMYSVVTHDVYALSLLLSQDREAVKGRTAAFLEKGQAPSGTRWWRPAEET